eukprot:5803778-Amphidinium_carterae.1
MGDLLWYANLRLFAVGTFFSEIAQAMKPGLGAKTGVTSKRRLWRSTHTTVDPGRNRSQKPYRTWGLRRSEQTLRQHPRAPSSLRIHNVIVSQSLE